MKDLWNYKRYKPSFVYPGRPAVNLMNSPECTVTNQNPGGKGASCIWEDDLFEAHVKTAISQHSENDTSKPLFIFWSTHTVHGPLQPKNTDLRKFNFINDPTRAKYHSMVTAIDAAIGRVVALLKEKGMYDNTLIAFSSDNGGPIAGGANNVPLKGGKFANWGTFSLFFFCC